MTGLRRPRLRLRFAPLRLGEGFGVGRARFFMGRGVRAWISHDFMTDPISPLWVFLQIMP